MCKCNCNTCFEEVPLSAVLNAATVPLPISTRIQSNRIIGLLVRRSGSATLKDVNGKTLAADSVIATAHLVLTTANGDNKATYPLSALQRDFNSPDPYPCFWDDIDPTQCSIKLDTGASGYDATHVAEIIFRIECPKNC